MISLAVTGYLGAVVVITSHGTPWAIIRPQIPRFDKLSAGSIPEDLLSRFSA